MMTPHTLALLSRLDRSTRSDILSTLHEKVSKKQSIIVHFLYYANLKKYGANHEYRQSLLSSDFLLPDGIALRLLWARAQCVGLLDFLQKRKTLLAQIGNLNGTDLIPSLLESGELYAVVLYGATDITNQKVVENWSKQFSQHQFWGQDGYQPLDIDELVRFYESQDDRPRLLLVGLGSPRQELWVETHKEQLSNHNIAIITVGGLFDFVGGVEKRAPSWIRRLNLEWLYRVAQNPRKNLMKTLQSLRIFLDILFF